MSHARKTKALTELEGLLGAHKSAARTKLLRAATEQLNVLEVEVANLRLVDTGLKPSLSYLEIAARVAAAHEDSAITEEVVRLAANTARQKLWEALTADEQTKVTSGNAHLPKPAVKFLLGYETD